MVWYCNRESVKTALDVAETARSNAQIDDAIEQGARDVDGMCNRPPNAFVPWLATRYFDYPAVTGGRSPSWRLRFDGQTLLSATSVTVDNGATTLAPGSYFLEPRNFGPPYTYLEINLAGSAALSSAGTHQRAVAVAGLWGWENTRKAVGSLSGTLAGTVNATAALAWTTARFGVGDLLFIDAEAMVISERTFVDSGQNSAALLDDSTSAATLAVPDGTGFALGEVILMGGEKLRVDDIAGNNLLVTRAWDGSQLEAHASGTDIFALTGVELSRAEAGTTIAAHTGGTTVYQWRPPALLNTLNRAYALNTLLQERSGWARALQAADGAAAELIGRGLKAIEADVFAVYGRKARTRGVR